MTSRARREGDHYILDGEKTFISNAGIAGHYVVFAKTNIETGSKGITAFLVKPSDPGFEFAGPIPLIADHPIGTIRFKALRIPASRRLGNEGDGFRIAMATLDTFRSTVGAASLGMARRALDEALSRAHKRVQFGKPIAEFQQTQAYLADMATELDAARLLVYRAALVRDRGADRVTLEASMAKMYATEAAQRIIDRALQIHGGTGVVRGHVLERLYREVRALRIYEGTTEIQKVVIASVLLGGERARSNEAQALAAERETMRPSEPGAAPEAVKLPRAPGVPSDHPPEDDGGGTPDATRKVKAVKF
jgi:acyl-CoA dehydrogenase